MQKITSEEDHKNYGIVYCITSPIIDAIKIGYWKGGIDGLYTKYTLLYGNDLTVKYTITVCPQDLEKKCHQYFSEKKITHKLYRKEYIDDYMRFLDENANTCIDRIIIDKLFNTPMTIIYLISIGTVEDLRKKINIPKNHKNDDIIAMFGLTQNKASAYTEIINNSNSKLLYLSGIDHQHASRAEKNLKSIFADITIKYKKYDKTIVFDMKYFDLLKECYESMSLKYAAYSDNFHYESIECEFEILNMKYNHDMHIKLLKIQFETEELKRKYYQCLKMI